MTGGAMAQSVRLGVLGGGLALAAAAGWIAVRASAAAPEPVCRVKSSKPIQVAEVLDGGALTLSDGRKVMLSGLETPRLKTKEGVKAPLAEEARAALAALVQGRSVSLSEDGIQSESGWVRAQVFAGSAWVQGEMVSSGFARVRPFADRRECARELLARETTARSAKRGVWGLKGYSILTPATVAKAQGSFSLVEGSVESAANIRGRVFLNFGPDFRTDFTIHVKPENVRLFAQSGIDLEKLDGKRIRVRGFVRERNGPVIDAAAPEQIEILP